MIDSDLACPTPDRAKYLAMESEKPIKTKWCDLLRWFGEQVFFSHAKDRSELDFIEFTTRLDRLEFEA